jgi:aminopeptidase C
MDTPKFLNRALNDYLRFCAQDLTEGKGDIHEMIAHIYKILAVNLGVPPKEFDWANRDAHRLKSMGHFLRLTVIAIQLKARPIAISMLRWTIFLI